MQNLSIIILASSYIKRMKAHGPPSLFKDLAGKTILEHQIQILKKRFPNADITVVSGLWADKLASIKTNEFRIIENQLFESTNEIEDLRLAINNISNNNVLILTGDLYFNHATFSEIPNQSFIMYDNKHQLENVDIGMTIVDKNATILSFDLHNKWVGIIYIHSLFFDKFKTLCLDRTKNRLFLFEIINNMVNNGYKFIAYQPENMKIMKVDSPNSLKTCKEKIYL